MANEDNDIGNAEDPEVVSGSSNVDTSFDLKRNGNRTNRGWLRSIFRSSTQPRGGRTTNIVERNRVDVSNRCHRRRTASQENTRFTDNVNANGERFSHRRLSWKSFRQYLRRFRGRNRPERSGSASSEGSNITIDFEGHRLEDSPVLPRANINDAMSNGAVSCDTETTTTCLLLKPPSKESGFCIPRMIHKVLNCPWYWGNIDRFDAAVALQTKADGYFLLRKSAHPDYLFTISFKRYNKTMHVRIETGYDGAEGQDSYEETVFLPWIMLGKFSPTYTCLLELIDHCYQLYEENMYNSPLLVSPLNRKMPFSLKDSARAAVYKWCLYPDIDSLFIPDELAVFLKEYRYKSKLSQES